jgi:hypothetical protein
MVWEHGPTFSDLYGIACAKDASIAAYLELSGGSNKWNVSFARPAQLGGGCLCLVHLVFSKRETYSTFFYVYLNKKNKS